MTWTKAVVLLILLFVEMSCTSPGQKAKDLPLNAPAGAPRSVIDALNEGNGLFETGQWEQARDQYEIALIADPTVAEAHYDLGLVLDRLGRNNEALAHYRKAADLAPGNRVIWNAPPFRQVDADVGKSRRERRTPRLDPPGTY